MPPHSIGEWIVGRNITPRTFGRSSKREVVKAAVSTDDENESNTLSVTYPRTRKTAAKKVRFHVTSPRRSALKQWGSNSSSETLVGGNTSSSDADEFSAIESDEVDYDAEDSYQGGSTDSSTQVTKTRTTKVKRKHHIRTVELGSSTDDETDDEPHPTCPCPKCIAGRRRSKIAKKRQKKADTSEDDETQNSEISNAKPTPKVKKQQGKATNTKALKDEATSTEASEATQTDDKSDGETTDEPTVVISKKERNKSNEKKENNLQAKDKAKETASKGKNNGKNAGNGKANNGDSQATPNPPDKSTKSKTSKKSAKLPEPSGLPSDLRVPNLIMPVTAKVLQVEHTVETPDDPRPNAFVDHEHGVVRVYHGPAYGNPFGSLYPRRSWTGQVPPAGVPHPLDNPYYNGFKQPPNQNVPNGPAGNNWPQPSGGFPWPSSTNHQASFLPPAPMQSYGSGFPPPQTSQVAGMTDEQAAAAIAQGVGLSGLPPHPLSIPANANPFPWEREGRKAPDPWDAIKDKINDAANNVGPGWGTPRAPAGSANGGSQKSNNSKSKNGRKSQNDGNDGWPSNTDNNKPWSNGNGDNSWPRDNNNANQDGNDNWGAVGDNKSGSNDKTGGDGWTTGWGDNGSQRGGSAGNGGWGNSHDNNGTEPFHEPATDQPADTGKGGGNGWGHGSNNGFQNDSGGWGGNSGGDNQGWGGGSNRGSNNGDWNSGGNNGGWNGHNSPAGQGSHRGSDSGKTGWNNGPSSTMPGAWGGSQNGGGSRQASGGWDNTPNNVGGWNSGGSNHHNSPNMASGWDNSGRQGGNGSHHGSNFGGNGGWGDRSSQKDNSGWGNNNDRNNNEPLPPWADPTLAQSTKGPGMGNW